MNNVTIDGESYSRLTLTEIEDVLVTRTRQYIAIHGLDPVRDYEQAHDAVLYADPDLKEAWAYAGVADDATVIEGPRNVPEYPEKEQDMRDLKARYGRGADGAAVVNAKTLRELVGEIYNAIARDATRTGADPQQAWRQALDEDEQLRRAVARS